LVHREDPASGAVEITASRPPGSEGISGHGVVATLTFQASATGRFPVEITKAAVVQPDQQLTAASVAPWSIRKGPSRSSCATLWRIELVARLVVTTGAIL
jgi:hypothetical protein